MIRQAEAKYQAQRRKELEKKNQKVDKLKAAAGTNNRPATAITKNDEAEDESK